MCNCKVAVLSRRGAYIYDKAVRYLVNVAMYLDVPDSKNKNKNKNCHFKNVSQIAPQPMCVVQQEVGCRWSSSCTAIALWCTIPL